MAVQNPVNHLFTASGSTPWFQLVEGSLPPPAEPALFEMTVSGTFNGAVWVEATIDGGANVYEIPDTRMTASGSIFVACKDAQKLFRATAELLTGTPTFRLVG